MSVVHGVTALYVSHAYGIVVSLCATPLILRLLGAEGYGLVGVFMFLFAAFQVLDLGLPSVLMRHVARWHSGATSDIEVGSYFRSMEILFRALAAVAASAVVLAAPWIAGHWLKPESLEVLTVELSLVWIALACALRWAIAPYRAALTGCEQFKWLAAAAAAFTSLRFVIVLPWVYVASDRVQAFFMAQVAVSALEYALHAYRARHSLPHAQGRLQWRDLAVLFKDSQRLVGLVAVSTVLWFLTTHIDRLILSNLLSLQEYGYFILATSVASAAMQMAAPLGQGVMPRLSRQYAAGDESGLRASYTRATQAVCVVAASFAGTIAPHAEAVLYAWTGDAKVAMAAAPILRTYVIAQALLALCSMPYLLQLAIGNLRLHTCVTLAIFCVAAPTLVWASIVGGALVSGYVWCAINLGYLVFWVPIVHRKFMPTLHASWFLDEVLPICLPVAAVSMLSAASTSFWPEDRWLTLLSLGMTWVVTAIAACLAANKLRSDIANLYAMTFRWMRGIM